MNQISVNDFSLKHTLECGQIFRYDLINGYYYLVYGDKVIKLQQKGNLIFFDSNSKDVDAAFLENIFRLDGDYAIILGNISKDKVINSAVKCAFGLRLMRQDPWECMVSYICSSQSSVKGVKQRVNNLSKRFGKKINFDGLEFYSFPKKLDDLKAIRECGIGFRSENLFETASAMNNKRLLRLKELSYREAKNRLIELKGVGDKIADCICLFSLDFLQAFPIDRWVMRVMHENYVKGSNRRIGEFASGYFGTYAGYAQQFLFYWKRLK